jgi:cell wall-associated NlpC family hydrolase
VTNAQLQAEVSLNERELERQQRSNVVRIALEWERTPYVHQGRIKGKAADCTFFAKVYEEAGLLPPITIPPYSHQAHLNRQGAMYLPIVERHAKREIGQEQAGPGDVVMYFIARSWSHGAVILSPGFPRIIHADMAARHVIIGEGDQGFFKNVQRRFFSWW